MAGIGKQVGTRRYIHTRSVAALPVSEATLVHTAQAMLPPGACFNVVRVDLTRSEVGFLNYPDLGATPFPELVDSWRVHVPTSLVTRRNYSGSSNPPILHRTELLLPDDHPARPTYDALTRTCEAIGLFDNPTIIGFRRNWEDLIYSKGFALAGTELLPIANSTGEDDTEPSSDSVIQRHRTALSRSTISAPVQCLLRDELLTLQTTFFDYGCGKGDDVTALIANGFRCGGWDPYFQPETARTPADVVNLGFVINVIEDLEERADALESAYSLSGRVLAVSAMLETNLTNKFAAYRDGVITSRSTFQKYYSQGELQHFLESVLGEDAYSAAPGIFYLFRDRELEQRYLLRKASGKNGGTVSTARLSVTPVTARTAKPSSQKRGSTARSQPSAEALGFLEQLWLECVQRGHPIEAEEVAFDAELKHHFGSFNKALRQCLARHDQRDLEKAARQRREDILVMLALRIFEQRRQFVTLDRTLSKDIRAFFGSMRAAETLARELLFSIQDDKLILDSCRSAVTCGFGNMADEQSLQIHTSLLSRLPAVLRVYVGCASAMAGDLAAFDLTKIHIGSGKVTLLQYDDFTGKPLPALARRVKVSLKDQQIDIFEHGDKFAPTLLFQKSRYINEEFSHYAEQVAFEETLEAAGLMDTSIHGPPTSEFERRMQDARYHVLGFRLLRSDRIPSLDEMCGAHFRFRDLIECGETWASNQPENRPKLPETYNSLCDLARAVLDPVVDYFGSIKLTYGFASPALTRQIEGRIAPRLDQHASCEIRRDGQAICERLGAAADFFVEYENMREVAAWIAANCAFDRLYFYGNERPIHVSVGPQNAREIFELVTIGKRRVPRKLNL